MNNTNGSEKWRPITITNAGNRMRTGRSMPEWMSKAGKGGPLPPPPPSTRDNSRLNGNGFSRFRPDSPTPDPEYEVIECPPPATQYMNSGPPPLPAKNNENGSRRNDGRRCDLCGNCAICVRCEQCANQIFCLSCDDMYHRHPKRQTHVRKPTEAMFRPPLPPKGESAPAPVPPPRRNKRPGSSMTRLNPSSPLLSRKEQVSSHPSPTTILDRMGSIKRMISSPHRPLPATPSDKPQTNLRQPPEPPKQAPGATLDSRLSSLQERYRQHQEAMKNLTPSERSRRESTTSKQSEAPSTNGGNISPTLSHTGVGSRAGSIRGMSASVLDLHRAGMVSPGMQHVHHGFTPMQQAQSLAQLNCMNCQQHGMWPQQLQHLTGSNLSLNMIPQGYHPHEYPHPPIWMGSWGQPMYPGYPMGMMSGMPNNGTLPRRRSSSRPVSPTLSLKSRKSHVSRSSRRTGRGDSVLAGMVMADDEESDDEENDRLSYRSSRQRRESFNSRRRPRGNSTTQSSFEDDIDDEIIGRESLRSRNTKKHDIENVRQTRSKLSVACDTQKSRRRSNTINATTSRKVASSASDNESVNQRFEDDMTPLGPPPSPPDHDWECEHCTFLNEAGVTICGVCCKTPSGNSRPRKSDDLHENFTKQMKISSAGDDSSEGKKKGMREEETYSEVLELQNSATDHTTIKKKDNTEKIERISTGCGSSPPREIVSEISNTPVNVSKTLYDAHSESKLELKINKQSDNKQTISTGTSPPPQSISTQTYDELPTHIASREKDEEECRSSRTPRALRRSHSMHMSRRSSQAPSPLHGSLSRQSFSSDAQSLPNTPPRELSPTRYDDEILAIAERALAARYQDYSSRNYRSIIDLRRPELYREQRKYSYADAYTRNDRSRRIRAESQPPDSVLEDLIKKRRADAMKSQGMELVRMLREAEQNKYTAEELQAALAHCSDGSDPVAWLKANWSNMTDTVRTLATNYGHERRENTVGTISTNEARDALRQHRGNVWAAVTECVDQRQKKYADLMSRGNFTREDIITSLTANHGDAEAALVELNKSQLKPFLMRIWGPPAGIENDSANSSLIAPSDITTNDIEIFNILAKEDSNLEEKEHGRAPEIKSDLSDLKTLSDFLNENVDRKTLASEAAIVSMRAVSSEPDKVTKSLENIALEQGESKNIPFSKKYNQEDVSTKTLPNILHDMQASLVVIEDNQKNNQSNELRKDLKLQDNHHLAQIAQSNLSSLDMTVNNDNKMQPFDSNQIQTQLLVENINDTEASILPITNFNDIHQNTNIFQILSPNYNQSDVNVVTDPTNLDKNKIEISEKQSIQIINYSNKLSENRANNASQADNMENKSEGINLLGSTEKEVQQTLTRNEFKVIKPDIKLSSDYKKKTSITNEISGSGSSEKKIKKHSKKKENNQKQNIVGKQLNMKIIPKENEMKSVISTNITDIEDKNIYSFTKYRQTEIDAINAILDNSVGDSRKGLVANDKTLTNESLDYNRNAKSEESEIRLQNNNHEASNNNTLKNNIKYEIKNQPHIINASQEINNSEDKTVQELTYREKIDTDFLNFSVMTSDEKKIDENNISNLLIKYQSRPRSKIPIKKTYSIPKTQVFKGKTVIPISSENISKLNENSNANADNEEKHFTNLVSREKEVDNGNVTNLNISNELEQPASSFISEKPPITEITICKTADNLQNGLTFTHEAPELLNITQTTEDLKNQNSSFDDLLEIKRESSRSSIKILEVIVSNTSDDSEVELYSGSDSEYEDDIPIIQKQHVENPQRGLSTNLDASAGIKDISLPPLSNNQQNLSKIVEDTQKIIKQMKDEITSDMASYVSDGEQNSEETYEGTEYSGSDWSDESDSEVFSSPEHEGEIEEEYESKEESYEDGSEDQPEETSLKTKTQSDEDEHSNDEQFSEAIEYLDVVESKKHNLDALISDEQIQIIDNVEHQEVNAMSNVLSNGKIQNEMDVNDDIVNNEPESQMQQIENKSCFYNEETDHQDINVIKTNSFVSTKVIDRNMKSMDISMNERNEIKTNEKIQNISNQKNRIRNANNSNSNELADTNNLQDSDINGRNKDQLLESNVSQTVDDIVQNIDNTVAEMKQNIDDIRHVKNTKSDEIVLILDNEGVFAKKSINKKPKSEASHNAESKNKSSNSNISNAKRLQQGLLNKVSIIPFVNKILPNNNKTANTLKIEDSKSTNIQDESEYSTSTPNTDIKTISKSTKGKGLKYNASTPTIKKEKEGDISKTSTTETIEGNKKKNNYFRESCFSDEDILDDEPAPKIVSNILIKTETNDFKVDNEEEEKRKTMLEIAQIIINSEPLENQARRFLAEGLVRNYSEAELAVTLIDLKFDPESSLYAARECDTLDAAVAFLQQECELCTAKYPMHLMISMLRCVHRCCKQCAKNYFTIQIKDRAITDCICPFCKDPDLTNTDEDDTLDYFSHLDILLKSILEVDVYELFQRKLRDRTLMQDPNFKWCVKCSSGFFAHPRHKRLICPDCRSVTCAQCRKPWEKQHEGITCEKFAEWKEANDPDVQAEGVARHLRDHGIDCPKCKFRYALSRGGCMHFTCSQCKYEFCCGCGKPFTMGAKCGVSTYCGKLGLHAHHPRNCLFYLRDKEPHELQKLLKINNIPYDVEPPYVKELPKDEDGAVGGKPINSYGPDKCQVQLQKETPAGLIDSVCSADVLPGQAGLCRGHYVEYLVTRVRAAGLDPLPAMDLTECVQELRRRGIALPERGPWDTDDIYRGMCQKIVLEQIPLD